ncbi:MAG: enoyl-CoA hydratase/isomerase family protein [Firmicutes bacterium]|nr:enoyl-CoA hydratase/isomerase family protein [Bacillota bacterium]
MNTINPELREGLHRALEEARSDGEIRAVLLTGRGRAFCAGYDLGLVGGRDRPGPREVRQLVRELNELYLGFLELEKPVVCAVNGVAAGGGFALVLVSDLVVAADDARFTTVFVRRGLFPDVGVSYLLPRIVGLARARWLMLTAAEIDAATAERIGLVHEVVPAAQLQERASALAATLARAPTVTLGLAKTLVLRNLAADVRAALAAEADAQGLSSVTEDWWEGITAFLEKRPPRFRGR